MLKPLRTRREWRAEEQSNARKLAEVHRKYHEAGDSQALMDALYYCLKAGVVVPRWAAEAFGEGYLQIFRMQVPSWDEVFGRPGPIGMHLASVRRNEKLMWLIYDRARWRQPKDEALFEEIGRELGQELQFDISAGQCRKLYYASMRKLRELRTPSPDRANA